MGNTHAARNEAMHCHEHETGLKVADFFLNDFGEFGPISSATIITHHP